MKNAIAGFCLLTMLAVPGRAGLQGYLNGYSKTVSGPTIDYRSCQPDAGSALLVRSLDAGEAIEWETDPVSVSAAGTPAKFVWVFGLNGNLEARDFYLSINGIERLVLRRPARLDTHEWIIKGTEGVELEFQRALIDKNDDLFGYAMLSVPAALLVPGKPLTLRVRGESVGSRAWYMTFQHAFGDTAVVSPQEALVREGGKLLQPVTVDIAHFGPESKVSIVSSAGISTHTLRFGFNRIVLNLPAMELQTKEEINIRVEGRTPSSQTILRAPVRHWTVYLVQHAHTDIGYTRPQTDILPEHIRFIDDVLDYCDQTDALPDEAKFRWTCEASWPVREYLRHRPRRQIERLKKRIAEGRVEVTGMMFNMAEIADDNSYAAFLQPIRECHERGIPVVTAMQDDVNGAAWCLPEYFNDIGVRYLTMGQNDSRALKPFAIPTSFWWESPSGKKLLVFRADHYMTGNFLSLERGRLDAVESEMIPYLRNLEKNGYPFDRIAVQYSGYMTDNSAPSTVACRVIQQWNEKYAWPRLRSATDHEFPEYIEKNHAGDLQTIRGAWPDWWTDGFGSAMRETGAARRTQSEMIAHQGLFAMAAMLGSSLPPDIASKIAAVQEALLFYAEHTFGAAESISDPRVENSVTQWAEKSAFVWDAVKNSRILRENAMGLLQEFLPRADVPSIALFNTLGWTRSGMHPVYIDNHLLPPDRKVRITDAAGNSVPTQLIERRQDGSTWGIWAKDVPAMGYAIYRIEVSPEEHSSVAPKLPGKIILENEFYRVAVDTVRGGVQSILDKQSGKELIDPESRYEGGEFIRETLTNREQLEQLRLTGFERTSLSPVRFKEYRRGDVWESVSFAGSTPSCDGPDGLICEMRLFRQEKRLEFHYSAMKRPMTSPEGWYIAFPFSQPGGRIVFEAQGGNVTPGIDQIPGSASDWNTIQSFAASRGTTSQIVVASREIPLMQFGDINLGKFQRVARVDKPQMFSWVLNNYWGTNFAASQEGELKWSYALTSSDDTSNTFAARFGWNASVPFVSRVLPAGTAKSPGNNVSLLSLEAKNIVMIAATPARDGTGIILHLREIEGKSAMAWIPALIGKKKVRSVHRVNVLEEPLNDVAKSMPVKPYESVFLKITFDH